MAVPWLDAARYADTHGYHIDSHRGMWPWRDWVIAAFNRNLPFDQFAIEQLAGDLLPDATREQKVASGFNRNHMINFEGGAIADEYQVEYVIDRVDATVDRVHGPDDGLRALPLAQVRPDQPQGVLPVLRLLQQRARARARRPARQRGADAPACRRRRSRSCSTSSTPAIETHEAALDDEVVDAAPARVGGDGRRRRPMRRAVDGIDRKGLTAHYELDGSFSDISGRFQHGRMLAGDPTFEVGQIGRAVTFDGDTEVSFGNVGRFDRADAFSLAVWMRARGNLPIAVFQKLDDAQRRRGFEWRLDDMELYDIQRWAARLTITLTSEAPANAIQVRTRERLKQGEWNHVVMSYDGSGKAEGLAIYANGKRLAVDVVRNALTGPIATDAAAHAGRQGARAAVCRADRRPASLQPRPDARRSRGPRDPLPAARDPVGQQRQAVEGAGGLPARVLPHLCRAGDAARRSTASSTRCGKQKEAVEKPIPTAMVMGELKKPRETFVLARGDYRNQTEKVQPGVPAMLPPLPDGRAAQPARAREVAGAARAIRSPRASRSIASGRCTSATASSRRRKISACRASRRASGAARLAGDRVRAHGLGRQRDAAAHRDVGDLSPVVEGDAGAPREGSREPAARARPAVPAAGRDDSRHGARGERPAQRRDRRPERAAVSAQGPVGGAGVRRWLLGADLRAEPAARICIAAACTRSGSARPRRLARDLRRARSREVHRPPRADQHAAPGAGAAERPDLRRSRARARAAHAARRRHGREEPRELRVPPGHGAQAVRQRGRRPAQAARDGTEVVRAEPAGGGEAAGRRRIGARQAARMPRSSRRGRRSRA